MLNCPKCLGKLEEKIVENVKVDVCWICEGVCFDDGELERVLNADILDEYIDLVRDFLDGKEARGFKSELNLEQGKMS